MTSGLTDAVVKASRRPSAERLGLPSGAAQSVRRSVAPLETLTRQSPGEPCRKEEKYTYSPLGDQAGSTSFSSCEVSWRPGPPLAWTIHKSRLALCDRELNPAFAPDGTALTFVSDRRSLSPLERPFRISRDPAVVDFDFSRDGRLVAFSRDERRGDIWILDAATTPF